MLLPVLWLLAILTNVTAMQRIYDVYQKTKGQPLTPPNPAGIDEPITSEPKA